VVAPERPELGAGATFRAAVATSNTAAWVEYFASGVARYVGLWRSD